MLNFRTKLLFSFFILSTVPAVWTGVFSYKLLSDSRKDLVISYTEDAINRLADDINQVLEEAVHQTGVIRNDPEFQEILKQEPSDWVDEYNLQRRGDMRLSSLIGSREGAMSVYVSGMNGIVFKSSFFSIKEDDFRGSKWFTEIIISGKPVWFPPHEGSFVARTLNSRLVSLGVPVMDKLSGRFLGVILVDITETHLNNLSDFNIGETARMLINYSDSEELVIRPQSNIYIYENGVDKIYKPTPEISLSRNDLTISKKLLPDGWSLNAVIFTRQIEKDFDILTYNIALVIFLTICLCILLSVIISRSVMKPVEKLSSLMMLARGGDLSVRYTSNRHDTIAELGFSFNELLSKIKQLLEDIEAEQKNLKKAELRALQAQINPHFLYNTLDSISWLAREKDYENIIEMNYALTSMLRTGLNKGNDIIPLHEEIEHSRNYLIIQKIRYEDSFDYDFNIDESILDSSILKLLIQPLIENAIYHGVRRKRRTGKIEIDVFEENCNVVIEVNDDGPGAEAEDFSRLINELDRDNYTGGTHYGLKNVNDRIRIFYGSAFGLIFKNRNPEGFAVKMVLPYKKGVSV